MPRRFVRSLGDSPSQRPRQSFPPRWTARSDDRPAPAIVGSWAAGTLHLWGWDGSHTALPHALQRAFAHPRWDAAANPFVIGHLSSLEVVLPSDERIRPGAVRLPADRAARWLRQLPAGRVPVGLGRLARRRRPVRCVDRRRRPRRAVHPHRP